MSPETSFFLQKARKMLVEASTMVSIGFDDAAGRAAYLAGFHAAQALISERLERAVKTHRGVNLQFRGLVKDDPNFPDELRPFLAQAYNLKQSADYGTAPNSATEPEEAKAAIKLATSFVDQISLMLASPP